MDQEKKALSRVVGGILCLFGAFVLSIVLACTSPIGNGGKELERIAAALGLDTLHPELDRIADSIQPKTTDLDLIAEALGLEERVSHSGKELDSISQAVLGTPTVPAPSNDSEGTAQPQPVLSPPVSQPGQPVMPVSNVCSQAETILGTVSGTTESAWHGSAPSCDGEEQNGPGVFYKVEGDGSRFKADTCHSRTDFDTVLSVYSGSCDNLFCVAANDQHDDDSDCGEEDHSSVSWETEFGETYYILVHGYDGASGEFRLGIDTNAPPDNDACRRAEKLTKKSRKRTNVGASIDDEAPMCNDERVLGPGVWFKIEGGSNSNNRYVYTADTCDEDTDFDTIISVYRGSCSNLECVTANDNHGGSCDTDRDHSSVTWNFEEDETYYILVHGKRDDDIGEFIIDVDQPRQNPSEPAPQPTPSRPSTPSFPSSPSRPSSPSFPSRPSSPSFPSRPSSPSFPSRPSSPSFPSSPSRPSSPSSPSLPSSPSRPASPNSPVPCISNSYTTVFFGCSMTRCGTCLGCCQSDSQCEDGLRCRSPSENDGCCGSGNECASWCVPA